MFGRFSQQNTLTLPPSTFGLRTIPGLSVPVGLGNSTTYAGNNALVAHHAVIAATHVFSPTFIVDARFGYGRFNLHALKDGAEPGANLGEKLGVKNSNQGPFSYGLPIFSPSSYTRDRRSGCAAHDPARKHVQSEYQFYQDTRRPHHQVRNQHRAAPDHRLPDQSGRRPFQFRSDVYFRPQ